MNNYRYHPIIEGLRINEDGSSIIYLGDEIPTKKLNRASRNSDTLLVYFNNQQHSVARLVCEAWHGMAENMDFVATRRNPVDGFHYKNLFWAKKGVNPNYHKIKFPRSSISKIPESEVPKIEKRLKKGETLKSIAKDYNTSDMSISRIKKKMEERNE